MLKQLFDILNKDFSFIKGKRLGIAVSGGLDSMTLVHLLKDYDCQLTLLHCNFSLRAEESDQDQTFLEEFSKSTQLPLEVIRFDTKQYADKHKLSTQMAARELRYDWFDKIIEDDKLDYIATAHHANDNVETLLINLSRGSGIYGLSGIPAVNGSIIRPLLSITRNELELYANGKDLKWREDSSNQTDAYLRNAIRHKVLPELEALAPDFVRKASESQAYLKESKQQLDAYMAQLVERIVRVDGDSQRLKIAELQAITSSKGFLFAWLRPYGFTAWDDIGDLLTAQSGKQIESSKYLLTKNREELILSVKTNNQNAVVNIPSGTDKIDAPISLAFSDSSNIESKSKNQIIIDVDMLKFPLQLRRWQDGDRFYPLGMDGSKKVSDYFTDLKISRPEKEKIWLLCSDQKIVWIVGHRGDDRFKVSPETKNSIAITYSP